MTKLDVSISELAVAALVAIAIIFSLAIFNGASAESTSKGKYRALEVNANTEYKAAKVRCELLLGNVQTLCNTKAEGVRDTARARLQQDSEKVSDINKEETVKLDDVSDKRTLYKTYEFNDIYHVNA